jgi:hypothetical protein
MKKVILIISTTIVALYSCIPLHPIWDVPLDGPKPIINSVAKNSCGLLVFKDSIQYEVVYNDLETKQEAFEKSAYFATALDQEQPLTGFEVTNQHSSYRMNILLQEDIAEFNDIDLSENPIPEVFDDDVVLQTLLSKERMLIIDNTIYYYFDDCTLYKFPAGDSCAKNIKLAVAYFGNMPSNLSQRIKPPFVYETINVCNDEISFKTVKQQCQQEIEIESCITDKCRPGYINFTIFFPLYNNNSYQFQSGSYSIDSADEKKFSPEQIQSNPCGFSLVRFGFNMPPVDWTVGSKHKIKVKATFFDNVSRDTCSVEKIDSFTISKPCSLGQYKFYTDGLLVGLSSLDNPCTPGRDSFSISSNGDHTVESQTMNSIVLRYECAGKKTIFVKNSDPHCPRTDTIPVTVTDANCCTKNRLRCWERIEDGTYRIRIRLKERNRSIVAIVTNFKKPKRGPYKRHALEITGTLRGSLYYEYNTCECWRAYEFSKGVTKNAKRVRIKFKLRDNKTDIETKTGRKFNAFKKIWSRKNDDPWKFIISAEVFNNTEYTYKINCAGQKDGKACNQ